MGANLNLDLSRNRLSGPVLNRTDLLECTLYNAVNTPDQVCQNSIHQPTIDKMHDNISEFSFLLCFDFINRTAGRVPCRTIIVEILAVMVVRVVIHHANLTNRRCQAFHLRWHRRAPQILCHLLHLRQLLPRPHQQQQQPPPPFPSQATGLDQ